MLVKTIKWPLIGALIAGTVHFIEVAIWPELQNVYTPPVLGLMQFTFGFVVGYLAIRNGGNFLTAVLYGAALGLFPLIVYPLSFGVILGEGIQASALAGMFGFSMMLFGSLAGGALSVSMKQSKT